MHQGPQQACSGFAPRGCRPDPSSVGWAAGSAFRKKLMEGRTFPFNGIMRPSGRLTSVPIYLTFLFTLQPHLKQSSELRIGNQCITQGSGSASPAWLHEELLCPMSLSFLPTGKEIRSNFCNPP